MYCLRGIQNVLTSHSVDLSPGKVNKINTYVQERYQQRLCLQKFKYMYMHGYKTLV